MLSLIVPAAVSFSGAYRTSLEQIVTGSDLHAPEVALTSEPAVAGSYMPVVFLHGMGDSGKNPGMKSLCQTAATKYPGLYSVCSTVADGVSSITTVLDKQIDEFTASVRADPKLANGFTAVGLSQGNLVLRGYIQRVNKPPVHKFVSICGPHNGVGTCPDNLLYKMVCPLWHLDAYNAPIAFSDYWKDVTDEAKYLSKSRWLADMNNERDAKNATYKANLMSLKQLVLVEALNDTMVVPHASETFGFWAWGQKGTVQPLEQTDGYQGDFLGLKSMAASKQLQRLSYVCDHLRFSKEFWNDQILPIFAD
jgi:palmitoyl-protein thioesterase